MHKKKKKKAEVTEKVKVLTTRWTETRSLMSELGAQGERDNTKTQNGAILGKRHRHNLCAYAR